MSLLSLFDIVLYCWFKIHKREQNSHYLWMDVIVYPEYTKEKA